MRKGRFLLCGLCAVLVGACDQPKTVDKTPAPSAPPVAVAPTKPADAAEATKPEAAKIPVEELEKAYEAAKSAYEKGKKDDQANKSAYLKATMAVADGYMFSQEVDTKVKYKKALQYYREVVKVDPANKQAQENADLIVSIYKSMGRPVPE